MKKTWFYAVLAAIVLITLIAGQGYAQTGTSNQGDGTDMEGQAYAPAWTLGWADRETSDSLGSFPSVAYNPSDGLPYISYYDAENGNLMLASPVATSGTGNCGTSKNWWCRAVDTVGNVGSYSSIDFFSGVDGTTPFWKLGISYHDVTNDSLKYAVWTQYPTGGFWHIITISVAADLGSLGTYTTLKYDSSGVPHILYRATLLANSFLSHAQYVGAAGNCGLGADLNLWKCETVDSGPGIGMYASLDISLWDSLLMAYYDGSNSDLKYAYRIGGGLGNCGTGSNYMCAVIDSAGDVGKFASITAPGHLTDVQRIAYYDATNGTVKFAFPTQTTPNCGGGNWFCGDVDTIGAGLTAPVGISMTLDKKYRPVIAYMNAEDDQGPSTLYIARPYYATGLNWGNCGDTLPGYLFTFWQCEIIDNAAFGQGYVDLASYDAIAVSPHGQITIPYYAEDSYDLTDGLRVAQTLPTFADVPFAYWAHDYIDTFYFAGITTGCNPSPLSYCPERNVTRAEMAVFILRAKNGLVTPSPAQTGMFADVPVIGKEWMQDWIEEFYLEGITTGCGVGPLVYCPERNVTRAEMAVFILRATHGSSYQPPAKASSFADVPVAGKAWMQPWIEQYYTEGLTTGCGYNLLHQLLYCPERNVTRAEMAVFIDRAFDIP